MNKYIDVEKLKKLIDEKWKELADKNVKVGGGKWDAEISTYLSVLRLIDTLQQEQPEIQNGKFVFPKYLYARTKDNKTIDMSYAPQDMTAVEYIRKDFVEQERTVLPDNLDEAAEEYENTIWEKGRGYCPQDICDAFKAGAEWVAKQGETAEWKPIKEQTEKTVQPTVATKGWVAQDYDGAVRLFFLCKPQRIDDKRYRYWYGGSNASKQLSNDSFPDLKWEDEPIEVALLIKE